MGGGFPVLKFSQEQNFNLTFRIIVHVLFYQHLHLFILIFRAHSTVSMWLHEDADSRAKVSALSYLPEWHH